MALIWADGFDHWGTNANALNCYTEFNGSFDTSKARTGPSCFSVNSSIRRAVVPGSRFVTGAAFRVTNISGNPWDHRLLHMFGPRISLCFNENYGITLIQNSSTILWTSAPNLWAIELWFYAEMYVRNDSPRTIEIRLNGVTLTTFTSETIEPTIIDSIGSQKANGNWLIDDFYICDTSGAMNTSFLGDRRMRTLLPNADGVPQDWTPLTGTSGFAMIDDVPAAGNYIAATAAGKVSKFEFGPDLPANTANIAGLVVFERAVKSDAGTGTLTVGLENANGTITGAAKNPLLTMGYDPNPDIFELDGGGFYWDYNLVNNTKFVLSRTA